MRKVLLFAIFIVFIFASVVWSADISGTWTLTMKSPQGEDESFDLDIKADGGNLSINCSNHPVLKTLEGAGTLKGDAIKMDLKSIGEEMAGVRLIFTGKVTGDKMAGTREIDVSGMSGGPPGGDKGEAPGGDKGEAPKGPAEEISDAWTAVRK